MKHYKTDRLDLRLMDCMELMRGYPDKHFELAIVDPPYGIGAGSAQQGMWGASRLEKKIGIARYLMRNIFWNCFVFQKYK